MRIFANFIRDGITPVAESALRVIQSQLPATGLWVIAVYGNGNVRIFRWCEQYPPTGTMLCVGPYNRNALPEEIEEDMIFEMQQATRIAA